MIRRATSCLLLFLGLATASAQLDELQGLNGLQGIPLSELSQQDDNPLSATALRRSGVSLRVIAKELDKPEPSSDRKSHIYIFERPEDWTEFQKAGHFRAVDRRASLRWQPFHPARPFPQILRAQPRPRDCPPSSLPLLRAQCPDLAERRLRRVHLAELPRQLSASPPLPRQAALQFYRPWPAHPTP